MAKQKCLLKQETQEIDLGYSDTPNNDLSLSVFKDGTTFFNLHNVSDIKISRHFLENVGWVRRIKGYSKGKMVYITLFEKTGEKK